MATLICKNNNYKQRITLFIYYNRDFSITTGNLISANIIENPLIRPQSL